MDDPVWMLEPLTPTRRRHSVAVAAKASQARRYVPRPLQALVERAALLHDVGYGHPQLEFHPLDGASWLAQHGEDPRLCHTVATHSGAHWEAHTRGIDPALFEPFDCDADHIGLIRSVVTWADMTTSPRGNPIEVADRLAEILRRYPEAHPVHRSVTAATHWLLLAGSHPTATADLDPAHEWRSSFPTDTLAHH